MRLEPEVPANGNAPDRGIAPLPLPPAHMGMNGPVDTPSMTTSTHFLVRLHMSGWQINRRELGKTAPV